MNVLAQTAAAARQVPFFNYPALFEQDREQLTRVILDVCNRGAFIMQQELADFETELARYLGVPYALGVSDGTMALVIALEIAGVGPGDEVIIPTHTFVASASAVHMVGGTPVLCDCLPDKMMDVESARRMVTSKSKAVMPVQLNGRTCDMDAVQALAREHGLIIIEDSCQALGARFRGRPAGSFGPSGTFSFYPAKTLGCFGDGGGMIFSDETSYELAREYRDHGRGRDGKVYRFGHNSRLDNLQAAVLRVKLARYDEAIARRRAIAKLYQERLGDQNYLLLPPAPGSDPSRHDVYQNYEIEADRRDELREYLTLRGVGTILQWGGHMVHQFTDLRLRSHTPYAEVMSKRYMLLPMHHMLSDDDVHYVCDRIVDFYRL